MSLFQARTHDTRDTDVASFATYEEYLESQVTAKDRYYLQDDDLARQLVELGYRGHGFTLKRDEFMQRKRDMLESTKPKERKAQQTLCSAGKDLSAHRLLKALADREEDIRNGKLTVRMLNRIGAYPLTRAADHRVHSRSEREGPRSVRIHRLRATTQGRRLRAVLPAEEAVLAADVGSEVVEPRQAMPFVVT